MFGAKYSRLTFWIWSVLLLIPFSLFASFYKAMEMDSKTADLGLVFRGLSLLIVIMWINALANRIRDYGSNPWISVFSFIPLVNIGLALYYGIVQYKKKPEDNHNTINASDSSLTKAVYNHAKEVASEVKPMVEKYKQSHTTAQPINEEQSITTVASVNDDEIYEQVMLEIEEDRKVKSAWARALSQADGDKDKAEALYIQFRVKAIKDGIEANIAYQIKCEEDNKEKEKKLQLFLEKYNIQIDKKISETKYLTSNGPITWFKEAKYWRFN